MFLSAGVILPMTLFSLLSPSLLNPSRSRFWPDSSGSFPQISIGTQKRNESPSAPSFLFLAPVPTPSQPPPFQVWKQNNFDLALHSSSTARTSSLPTSFLTAETGNLLLACSVVLNCVTGTKWVPALGSAGNVEQKWQTSRVKNEKYRHD